MTNIDLFKQDIMRFVETTILEINDKELRSRFTKFALDKSVEYNLQTFACICDETNNTEKDIESGIFNATFQFRENISDELRKVDYSCYVTPLTVEEVLSEIS